VVKYTFTSSLGAVGKPCGFGFFLRLEYVSKPVDETLKTFKVIT